MANYHFDQAEGLRRILTGPKPRIFTMLSAIAEEEKISMLINLGASLASAGSEVLVVDACEHGHTVGHHLGAPLLPTLQQVAQQETALNQVVQRLPQGFNLASLGPVRQADDIAMANQTRRLANAFGVLATQTDVVIANAELARDDSLPIPTMSINNIVVLVSANQASITSGYALIKRVCGHLGRRPFGILVNGVSDKEARQIYGNMAQAASRYLALQLDFMGYIPVDDHVKRAARLGRTVMDAFPLAGASVAFRRLAGRFALSEPLVASANPGA